MKSYLISHIETKDIEKMKKYREEVYDVVLKFGGKYLVRGGKMESLEGEFFKYRMVVIEFPSTEMAKKFYQSDEYQPIKKLRLDSGISNTVILNGF